MGNTDMNLFRDEELEEVKLTPEKVICLGLEFESDDARRAYFRDELRKKLPELRKIEGFPIGEDDDIINLSEPPYYTACPNPWLNDFIAEWEQDKVELERQGKRSAEFEVDGPYTDGIKVGKNSAIYNAHSYHTKVPHQIIMRYILHYTQPGDIILDGFMGTGMTGVAATACGNPDSESKNSIEKDYENAGYMTPNWGARHAVCGDLSPLCFHISSNYNHKVNSKKLRLVVDAILVALNKRFSHFYEIKPPYGGVGHINYIVWSEVVACNNCGKELNVHDLSYNYKTKILYDKLKCPYCGTEQKRTEAESIFEYVHDDLNHCNYKELKYVPCLINYSAQGRYFSNDIPNTQLPNFEGFVPNNTFGEGDKFGDPYRVGCHTISQVYPQRTKYVLGYLYKLIHDDYKEYKKELMFIFTSMLPKLTKMNRYMPQHGSRALVGPMANTLYIPPQYVENNPIDQFEYQANKVINALEQCNEGNAVQVCSASRSSLPDNSIDYIFTDPPFGANIMYSELNTIAESWLKVKTNNKEEAISNKTQHKGIAEYQSIMISCLKEYYRVLKPGHWMTVEFSNTSASFWNSLQYSIQSAGFIISAVTDLNKERGGLHSMLGPTAVKQDLAISCYKPTEALINKMFNSNAENQVWDFIHDRLSSKSLKYCIMDGDKLLPIAERTARILYDRLISFFVLRGYNIPISSQDFQKGLRERYMEIDGMFFTAYQAAEYNNMKERATGVVPMALFIGCEADGIEWLKRELVNPKTYQEIYPTWISNMVAPKKGDVLPELIVILEENFIKDSDGKWRNPDPEKAADLELIRGKKMMKEFNLYLEQAQKPKAKRMKDTRLEVLRYGFKECYKQKDYQAIITVGDHIQESLLQEDEVLLQYYDIASTRV